MLHDLSEYAEGTLKGTRRVWLFRRLMDSRVLLAAK
jgi:hypothetical protein